MMSRTYTPIATYEFRPATDYIIFTREKIAQKVTRTPKNRSLYQYTCSWIIKEQL